MIAHLPLDRIVTGLAKHGVEARIHPGAQGRSARAYPSGFSRGCQANVVHHTGSSGNNPAGDINYIVRGKGDGYVIANAYAPKAGGIDLLASGPTYTEGLGGPRGIIPSGGANRVCNSLEIAHPGSNAVSYTLRQQQSVLAWAAVCGSLAAELWEWPDDPYDATRLFSHFEWTPGRKSDPSGPSNWSPQGGLWGMNRFRDDARTANTVANMPPPAPKPKDPITRPESEEDDMKELLTIWLDKTKGSDGGVYLVAPGGVIHLDFELWEFYKSLGVKQIEGTNVDVARSFKLVARGIA